VWKVMAGTGEALLGPGIAVQEQPMRITVEREVVSSREGGGGGRTSEDRLGQHNQSGAKGPYFIRVWVDGEESVHGHSRAQQHRYE